MFKVVLALSALILISCAKDPEKQKIGYVNSGNAYLGARKYDEAIIQFRNAIQIDAKFALAHSQLANAYLALGNSEAAFREFNTAVTLEPGNTPARLSLATLQIGRGQLADAQSTLKQILAIDPKNAQAHAILGQKRLVSRDLPGAIEEFGRVIELDPERITGYAALGAAYMATGHPAEAEAAYRKATEANSKSPDAHVALGEFYFSRGKLALAEAEMRAASNLAPKAVAPRLFLGRTLTADGRLADAETTYASLKVLAPDDPQAYQSLGVFYANTGQKDKALAEFQLLEVAKPNDRAVKAWLFETLIDLDRIGEAAPLVRAAMDKTAADKSKGADDVRILKSFGRILIQERKYAEAIAALRKVTAAEPDSAVSFYYLGVAEAAAEQPDQAKVSFARALELAPAMSQAAAALANLEVKRDQNQALRHADRAIESNPTLAPGYAARARTLIAKGDLVGGAAAIEDALRRDPYDLTALTTFLNLSVSEGRTAEAVQRIRRLVQQNPENAGLHFLLALSEFGMKDLDKAESDAKQAMVLDPRTPQVWALMANIDFSRGRTEQAKGDLRRGIAMNPGTVSNYVALGRQYERENNWEEATRLFEKAHYLDRDSAFLAAELAFLYLEHGGDINTALSLAQSARQQLPNSPVTADALGWAYYKSGSPDLAMKELEESVQLIPSNPVYRYHLGMAYAKAHNWDKATRTLRAVLKDDPNFPYAETAKATLDQIARQPKLAR